MSGTFLLGASHRNNQHCLGAVPANLRYRSWNVPTGAMDPTSIPDADPSASSTRSPGRSSTSHTPADGRRFLKRTHPGPDPTLPGPQPLGSPLPALRRTPDSLAQWAQCPARPLRADCVRGGSIGIPHGAQVTKATRAGRPGTGSWRPGPGGRRSPSPS